MDKQPRWGPSNEESRPRYIPPHERRRLQQTTDPRPPTFALEKPREKIERNRQEKPKYDTKPLATYGVDGLFPANPNLQSQYFPTVTQHFSWTPPPAHVKVQGNNVPSPIDSFQDIDLGPVLSNCLKLNGIQSLTPIQRYAIPCLFAGRDILAICETGSGKTGSYVWPIVARLGNAPQLAKEAEQVRAMAGGPHTRPICPLALVLTPTRELAHGVHHEIQKYCFRSHLKPAILFGGAAFGPQSDELKKGCQIVVATPGRLLDMLDRIPTLKLDQLQFLILDEADRMIDMGFEPQLRTIFAQCSHKDYRQTAIYSATFPKQIQSLTHDLLNDSYVFLHVSNHPFREEVNFPTQRFQWCEDHQKLNALLDLIPSVQGKSLVFCGTKKTADNVHQLLCAHGYESQVGVIHGDKTQQERTTALDLFRDGKKSILVATEVSAKGLDLGCCNHCILWDFPVDLDDYIFRMSRGQPSVSTSLVNSRHQRLFPELINILEDSQQEIEPWLRQEAEEYASKNPRGPRRGHRW